MLGTALTLDGVSRWFDKIISARGRSRLAVIAGAAISVGTLIFTTDVFPVSDLINDIIGREKENTAKIDYGPPLLSKFFAAENESPFFGVTPAIPKQARARNISSPLAVQKIGYFSPSVTWPIIPIHMSLLPDGRVMTFGTDQSGAQGAKLVYDVWDPKLGIGPTSHWVLNNKTGTDIFCGAASLLGFGFADDTFGNGYLLIPGGDQTVNGVRNFGVSSLTIFNPFNNSLNYSTKTMQFARWYPSITSLPNGDKLVMGGIDASRTPTLTPEIFHPLSGWRTLSGINIDGITEWYYPRSFVGFDGAIYLLKIDGAIKRLSTVGSGSQSDTGARTAAGNYFYPAVMGKPFTILALRSGMVAQIVDISSYPPNVTDIPGPGQDRIWANATILADGNVLVTGGSAELNVLNDVHYQAQIFNWTTKTWTLDAIAAKPRLYHSGALLLPDGSVLTGGGGAPGPVYNLNAEIYYPPYLYLNDGSGKPAPRPTIVSAPTGSLKLGNTFSVTVGSQDKIASINLIRLGSVTHSFDPEQRHIPVPFVQTGPAITASLDPSPNKIPPGYYMMFVFNAAGAPSIAKIIHVLQATL